MTHSWQLLAAWAQAEQGEGRVVSVVGEAEIGKSRLLRVALADS